MITGVGEGVAQAGEQVAAQEQVFDRARLRSVSLVVGVDLVEQCRVVRVARARVATHVDVLRDGPVEGVVARRRAHRGDAVGLVAERDAALGLVTAVLAWSVGDAGDDDLGVDRRSGQRDDYETPPKTGLDCVH